MKLCFKCRIKAGWVAKDNGVHTARIGTCEDCGEEETILPERHYLKNQKTCDSLAT